MDGQGSEGGFSTFVHTYIVCTCILPSDKTHYEDLIAVCMNTTVKDISREKREGEKEEILDICMYILSER